MMRCKAKQYVMPRPLAVMLLLAALILPRPSAAQKADEHYRAGLEEARLGRYDQAIKEFMKVLETEPNHAGTHYNLGNIYFYKRMIPEAIRAYRRAAALSPDDPAVHFNLAITYSLSNRIDKAIEELQRVVELRPADAEAHYQLAKAYLVRREPRKAFEHLRIASRNGRDAPAGLVKAIERMCKEKGKGC